MKFRTAVIGVCLASSLIFSPAFAVSSLPAGKPAGVKQAQMSSDTIVPLVLGGALVAGIAIASSQQGQVGAPVATTTGTSP